MGRALLKKSDKTVKKLAIMVNWLNVKKDPIKFGPRPWCTKTYRLSSHDVMKTF